MAAADTTPEVEARSRDDLRRWLAAHHESTASVWLVTWKKGSDHYVPFPEFVEELLCWGWVDSLPRKRDDDTTAVRISPRNPKSAWSAVNKALVEKARASGAMTPAGEAAIARAEANGMWSWLDDVEALIMPDDLARAISDHRDTWDGWAKTYKRGWLEKIKSARTEATRSKRIAACASSVRADTPRVGLA